MFRHAPRTLRGVRALRGYSLVELMLSLTVGGVLLAAGGQLLLTLRRFAAAQREVLAARQAARTAAAILVAEVRSASGPGGDMLGVSDTSLTLRGLRGLMVVCRAPVPGLAELVVRLDPALAPRAVQAGRDSLLVHAATSAEGRWVHAAVVAVGGGTCADGSPARRLTLAASPSARRALDSVEVGAPVRPFQVVTYRLYRDGSGTWWLGAREFVGTGWAATSPLTGPLRPRDGLLLVPRAQGGGVVAAGPLVARLDITVRSQGVSAVRRGALLAVIEDSLTRSAALQP